MACSAVVVLSFSAPLSAPKTLIQDTSSRRSVNRRLVKPYACKTVAQILHHSCSDRSTFSVHGSCQRCLMVAQAVSSEPFSYHFNVSSSTPIIISGFWVGPDIEDGWGFIEAVVDRML